MRASGYDYTRTASGVFDPEVLEALDRTRLSGLEAGESLTVPNQMLRRIRRPRILWRRP
jgi:hypothetical protein